MKLLATSDWHFASSYPYSNSPYPLQDMFFRETYASAKAIVDYAITNKIDTILHGGDLFDNEKIESPEYSIATFLLHKLNQANIPTYINLGNHEVDFRKTKIPSVVQTLCKQYENIHCCSQETFVFKCGGINIMMIPYLSEEEFNPLFEKICDTIDQPSILMIHQNIRGVRLGKTSIKQTSITSEGILAKSKDKFKVIICGHLHYSHVMGRIIIPGSICSIDFRDEDDMKSFYELTLDDNYNLVKIKQVHFTNQIIFKSFDVDNFQEVDNKFKYVIKLRYKPSQMEEYNRIRKQLENIAIIIPDIISEESNLKQDWSKRPINMSAEDWLRMYLQDKGYCDEQIEHIFRLNKRMFECDQKITTIKNGEE